MSNWPNKRASAANLLSRRGGARTRQLTIAWRGGTGFVSKVAAVVGVRSGSAARRRSFVRASHPFRRRVALARVPDAAGDRARRHLRENGIEVRAICRGRPNLSNRAIVFVGLLQKRARASGSLRPAPDDGVRYSSGLAGARRRPDMYINVQCRPRGRRGLPGGQSRTTLLKPMARGASRSRPRCAALRRFNFIGHELDLARFMQGFRRAVEVLAHEQVRRDVGVTFR